MAPIENDDPHHLTTTTPIPPPRKLSRHLAKKYMMKASRMNDKENKLRDGPCATPYSILEACAATKNVKSHREKMFRCPRQTDVLIKCVKKNPVFFHSNNSE
eukprot:CAMPEP_0196130156 /NCGR_PEP_ID=MMETSP0910-20130528/627_1 /TAXON_ID=49265 /ORGANISM="Thalassiosira rotula, Strain GSO102" /LENGTH=101 /DNA_ID=CAMNT_0041389405 /DNA_START=27 /DNA_END=332 /DNA_ORIENTATION=-